MNKSEIIKTIRDKDMRMLVFDTETTGLDCTDDKILSIAACMIDLRKINVCDVDDMKGFEIQEHIVDECVVDQFEEFLNWHDIRCEKIKSSFYIGKKVVAIHGIDEDVMHKKGKDPIEVLCHFYDFIERNTEEKDGQYFAKLNYVMGYNVSFDINMILGTVKQAIESMTVEEKEFYGKGKLGKIVALHKMFKPAYHEGLKEKEKEEVYNQVQTIVIDPLIFDRIFHVLSDLGMIEKHSLSDAGLRYGIPLDEKAHDAMSDVKRTIAVFKFHMDEWKKRVEENREEQVFLLEDGTPFLGRVFSYRFIDKYILDSKKRKYPDPFSNARVREIKGVVV